MYFIDLLRTSLNDWSGKFNRKEYTTLLVGLSVTSIVLFILILLVGDGNEELILLLFLAFGIWIFISFVATLVASVKRLHDLGKTGFYSLLLIIPLLNLILLCYLLLKPSNELEVNNLIQD